MVDDMIAARHTGRFLKAGVRERERVGWGWGRGDDRDEREKEGER